jgi:transposase
LSDLQLPREVRRRLAIIRHAEEVTGNVALTCRYYGISRQCYYIWYRRYLANGIEGLHDRSKRPLVSPRATHVEVVGKIIYLRQHYHFGPARIAMYLKRYHDVQISSSGVWRILKRLELNRLPTSQRYKRHDRRWKRDEQAAAWPPRPARREVHPTAIWCSQAEVLPVHRHRRLHPPSGPAHLPQAQPEDGHPIPGLCAGAAPVPGRGHPDRHGPEFGSSFHWHVLDRGAGHVSIKPRTPRLNGKVERSHRIDAEEFYRLLDGVVIDDAQVFNDKLQSGRTSTITTDPTAASTARPPMKDSSSQPRPGCNRSPSVAQGVQPTPPTAARSPRPTEPAWFGSVHVPQLGHEVPVPRRSGRSYAPPSGRVLQLKPARTALGAQTLQLARRCVTQGLPGSGAGFAMHHAGYPVWDPVDLSASPGIDTPGTQTSPGLFRSSSPHGCLLAHPLPG